MVTSSREDFLEYFNTNADSSDRTQDDAISTFAPGFPHGFEIQEFIQYHQAADASILPSLVVSLEGRMYPVETAYLEQPVSNYVEAAVQTVFDIHMKVCQTP